MINLLFYGKILSCVNRTSKNTKQMKSTAEKKTSGRKGRPKTSQITSLVRNPFQVPRTLNGFASSDSGQSREIVFRVTDFFDSLSTENSGTYYYRLDNNFLTEGDPSNITAPLQVIESVNLYAIPDFDLDTAASPTLVLFGCPVYNTNPVAESTTQSNTVRNAAQMSTLLMPASDSHWQHVGGWQRSQLFQDSMVQPVTLNNSAGFGFQALFKYSVVEPDNFDASPTSIQMKVVMTVRQSLPVVMTSNISLLYEAVTNWADVSEPGSTDVAPCIVQPLKLQDSE